MEASMKLWEITDELAEIGALLSEAEGELTPELEQRLDAMSGAFDGKVESIALFVRHSKLEAEKAKAEKDRLAAIEKFHARQADGLLTYLLRCMTAAGVTSVDTHRARVRVQKSGTPRVTFAGDVDELPQAFVRIIPEKHELDRGAVTEAFRAGKELPDGIRVEFSQFVRIL